MTKYSLIRPIGVTIFGLLIFHLGLLYQFPFFGDSHLASSDSFGLFEYGLTILVNGFLLSEFLSFFLPPFKAWRKQGFNGRYKLNITSRIMSVLVFISVFSTTVFFTGVDYLGDFVFSKQIMGTVFFLAGVVLVYTLGRLMTKYGLGNGFGVLIAFVVCKEAVYNIIHYVRVVRAQNEFLSFVGIALFFLLVALILKFFKEQPSVSVNYKGSNLKINLPALPGTVESIFITVGITGLLQTLYGSYETLGLGKPNPNLALWLGVLLFVVFYPIVGYLCYRWAYSPKRLENNLVLSKPLDESYVQASKKNFLKSLFFILGLGVVFWLPRSFNLDDFPLIPFIFRLADLLIVIFVTKDIIRNFLFLKSVDRFEQVAELDNVHLTAVIKSVLEREGVSFYIKGHSVRQLFAFFNPLLKMNLYVKSSELEKARKILGLESVNIV